MAERKKQRYWTVKITSNRAVSNLYQYPLFSLGAGVTPAAKFRSGSLYPLPTVGSGCTPAAASGRGWEAAASDAAAG